MEEHLSSEQIERFRRRGTSGGELLATDAHLTQCESCRRRVYDAAEGWAVLTAFRQDLIAEGAKEPTHLTYSQLAGFVARTLDQVETEIAQSHLEICDSCAAIANDVRAARVEPHGLLGQLKVFFEWPALAVTAVVALLIVTLGSTLLLRLHTLGNELQRLACENRRLSEEARKAAAATQALEAQLSRLQPAPETTLLALNDGGRRVILDREGNLSGVEAPPPLRDAVAAALRTGRVPMPELIAGLVGPRGSLRGVSRSVTGFGPLQPAATVVEADRPSFRWNPLTGASRYQVSVYGPDFDRVAASGELNGLEWTPVRSLRRGVTYTWQVTAYRGGETITAPAPPAPEAKFRILEAEKAAELERARREHAGSHLLLGVLYARAGVLDEAEKEFQALVGMNPQSEASRNLLSNLQGLRAPSK